MSYKEKIIRQLRKGYSPIEAGPKESINSIFKNTFKPLIKKKDLDLLFELCETNETLLRAWGFLGLCHVLKDKTIEDAEKKLRIRNIVIDLLNDENEINYYGGSIETRTSLREHHVRRICELDKEILFEPVFEYVQSSEGRMNEVIGELIENVLTKVEDSRVEPMILLHANNISRNDFDLKLHIINGFESLGQIIALKDITAITNLFKAYLKDIEEDKAEIKEKNEGKKLEIVNKKNRLRENILRAAAQLDLDLEKETLDFLAALTRPYKALHQIAKKYKNNEKFKSILLRKLKESENSLLIKDILISILILRENVQNWRDLVIENLTKFQIIDKDLMEEMQKVDLYREDIIIDFLNEGDKWHLEFIREFVLNNPEKLNEWSNFKNKLINILKFFKQYPNFKEKKELALRLVIDLVREDMIEYSLENFKNLEDSQLRKIALFAIIKFGKEELMLELKRFLEKNEESAMFFKKFWRYLKRNEWKFIY